VKSERARILVEVVLFLIIAALIYLPLADQFGYYNDDWYSMYAARVAGPQIFHEIYSIDRPGRAFVMIPLYMLFGGNPFYYSLSAYLFRVLGALSLLWLLRLLWPSQRDATLSAAFLFLVYPGFLSQPNAIDFQSHLVGICLAFLSLGFTIKALSPENIKTKVLFWTGAVLTGWGYLSQMEYYIGFEAVRLALTVLLARRENASWKKTIWPALKKWLPYFTVPTVYLFWRIFLFENQRPTTDLDLQFGKLLEAPLGTLYAWLMNFIQSILNVLGVGGATLRSVVFARFAFQIGQPRVGGGCACNQPFGICPAAEATGRNGERDGLATRVPLAGIRLGGMWPGARYGREPGCDLSELFALRTGEFGRGGHRVGFHSISDKRATPADRTCGFAVVFRFGYSLCQCGTSCEFFGRRARLLVAGQLARSADDERDNYCRQLPPRWDSGVLLRLGAGQPRLLSRTSGWARGPHRRLCPAVERNDRHQSAHPPTFLPGPIQRGRHISELSQHPDSDPAGPRLVRAGH
jgi:hypothetical protein